MEKLKLVGFRVLCPPEQYLKEISKAISLLSLRFGEIKNKVGAFFAEDKPIEEEGYWICVEVKEIEDVLTGMTSLEIPAQNMQPIGIRGQIMKSLIQKESMQLTMGNKKAHALLN
ncbi:GyrI-like domain-containing protein [Cytobacillus sp. NCCP-133]|uniref:GyrI-like domain-containing protein n=1 Tax=Cytobacillus sp. NCCP-133 TaxID=766848 RepID=UPI002231BAD8|nr:GyrI-like domain-containing protein [Cytobacillus sp. NCCP-133]GLB59566.1 hypothetical protein NCCP133_16990 [Cytobacillus sp. NCCP-133]